MRIVAVLAAVAVLLGQAACMFAVRAAPPGREGRAALVFRDLVSLPEREGSRAFTMPLVGPAYDDVRWFAQTRSRDEHHDAFVAELTELLTTHHIVDVFLLAHGNRFIDWVREIPAPLRARLRLVYDTGCGDAYQADEWLELGADAHVGHHGQRSMSPAFYVHFLLAWLDGRPVGVAVAHANVAMVPAVELAGTVVGDDGLVESTRASLAGDHSVTIVTH